MAGFLTKQIDLSDNLYSIGEKNLTFISPNDGSSPSSSILWRWAFSLPSSYGFYYEAKGGLLPLFFFLPIAPQNLSIETTFATTIIPTLYGTVEEHSSNRYFTISISGTTGITPQYTEFRADFLNKANSDGDPALPGRDVWGGSTTEDLTTGIDFKRSGYYAFHNLYRFLMQYKQDIMKTSNAFFPDISMGTIDIPRLTTSPLIFFNYKDNNKYKVSVESFSLVRSADSPMLYNYSIRMMGYQLSSFDSKDIVSLLFDQAEKIAGPYARAIKSKLNDARRIVSSFSGNTIGI